MTRVLVGSVAAAAAMFLIGFIFFATPLNLLAYSVANDAQNAAVQTALAANLHETGTYIIPWPMTADGTILYGRGPVATVHYNSMGFSTADMNAMLGGFIHMLVTAVLIAAALSGIAVRVTGFADRARLVVLFSLAASLFMHLGEPIWYHHDWTHFIYLFVADFAMFAVGGLVIAKWFLPQAASATMQ